MLHRATGDWEEAMGRAVAMVEELTRDFPVAIADLRGMRDLYPVGDDDWAHVETSLEDPCSFVAGDLRWHEESRRYHDLAATR